MNLTFSNIVYYLPIGDNSRVMIFFLPA